MPKKKLRYISNVTDDMLLAWSRETPFQKMKWLEAMRRIRGLAIPKNKRKLLRGMFRHS